MSKVRIKQHSRPVRLAYLVDPADSEMLSRVIHMNTSMWGGCFNAIVPALSASQATASASALSNEEVLQKYLNVFEPDFIVDTSIKTQTENESQPAWLGIDDLIAGEGEALHMNIGLSVGPLFMQMYDDEFQFTRRQPEKAVYAETDDVFLNACFGAYPKNPNMAGLKQTFMHVFAAEEIVVTPETFAQTAFFPGVWNPVRAGIANLRGQHNEDYQRRALLVDDSNPLDVIEYWNLRALGLRILPVPVRWASALAPHVVERIERNIEALGVYQPGLYTICGAESVSDSTIEDFHSALAAAPEVCVSRRAVHRPPWTETRSYLVEKTQEDVIKTENNRFTFTVLTPNIVPPIGYSPFARWVNNVSLDHDWDSNEAGFVLPRPMGEMAELLGDPNGMIGDGPAAVTLTSDGIRLPCDMAGENRYWKMPTGLEVVQNKVAEKGLTAKLNDKGSTAYEMIKRLGGLRGVGLVAHIELIDLLNTTTRGAANYEGKAAYLQTFQRVLKIINKHDRFAENHLQRLVEQKVVKLGLDLQCTTCNQFGWHGLDQLSDEVTCRRCLQTFQFPAHMPNKPSWAYHSLGPFSTSDYGMGSYSVVLALRFLVTHMHAKATWMPGVDLIDSSGHSYDADFMAFWQDTTANKSIETIIGECKSKSKGDFSPEDRKRAEYFFTVFPEAYFVFASLKEALSANDQRWLADFSKKAKVIVLNISELTSDRPTDLFHATFDSQGRGVTRNRLSNLSRLTCEKYLSMHSVPDFQI